MRQCSLEQRRLAIELIKELRSGKHQQGYGQLVTDDHKYCCLGIAGKILGYTDAEMREMVTRVPTPSIDVESVTTTTNRSGTLLSKEAAARYGFTLEEMLELARINDDGNSFHHIADKINGMFNS